MNGFFDWCDEDMECENELLTCENHLCIGNECTSTTEEGTDGMHVTTTTGCPGK